MASYVTINLDTRAPEVEFGAVQRPQPTEVIIPYEISPDTEYLFAELQVIGGPTLPVTITEDEFTITGVPDDSLGLRLNVQAHDDVLNYSLTSYDFMISVFEVFGRMRLTKALEGQTRFTPMLRAGRLRVRKLLDASITRQTVLSIKGQTKKILDATIKRRDSHG